MRLLTDLRCLRILVAASAAVLTTTVTADPPLATKPAPSPSPSAGRVASAAGDPDWFSGCSPAEFRALNVAQQEIDPTNFNEPLLAAAIFQETNRRREDLKLPAFAFSAEARAAAFQHSDQMAKGNYLSHDSTPDQPKNTTPYDRLVREGLHPQVVAENIAFNFLLRYEPGKPFYARQQDGRTIYSYQPDGEPLPTHTYVSFAEAILTQWMNSPPHRQNIVDPDVRLLGVGCALRREPDSLDTVYADQDFFTPLPEPTPPPAH